MGKRYVIAMMAGAALMAAATPAAAQTFVLTASLTSGNEPASPGTSLIPFFDTTRPFGSATMTVDLSTRTIAYSISVFNLPGNVTSQIRLGAPGTAGLVVVDFARPMPASVVLNNIADDVCYEIASFAFDGSVTETGFVLRPELGIRSADDVLQAMLKGNAYLSARAASSPDVEIRGPLVRTR
jgi:hypothetical protein